MCLGSLRHAQSKKKPMWVMFVCSHSIQLWHSNKTRLLTWLRSSQILWPVAVTLTRRCLQDAGPHLSPTPLPVHTACLPLASTPALPLQLASRFENPWATLILAHQSVHVLRFRCAAVASSTADARLLTSCCWFRPKAETEKCITFDIKAIHHFEIFLEQSMLVKLKSQSKYF